MTWLQSTFCFYVDRNALLWQRAEVKWSMHRWYLEGLTSLYLFVSKRLSRQLLLASAPSVCKGIKGRRHIFSVPGGRDHPWRSWACWEPWGKRAPLWCLEGRPHPAAALKAPRCLARAGHRWKGLCVYHCFHRRGSWICQVQVQGT